MAKLYFRHGAVGSAKTLNLLAVAHSYRQQGKQVRLLKPRLDTRFGSHAITSRAGLEQQADMLLDEQTTLAASDFTGCHCILVDEAQFLAPRIVEALRRLTLTADVPVICYGLRTDFRTKLFAGSQRLLELSDVIEEVKSTCHYCNRKAVFNLKHRDGRPISDGPIVELGAEETYLPACHACYVQAHETGLQP
jgi:thymidine kinase